MVGEGLSLPEAFCGFAISSLLKAACEVATEAAVDVFGLYADCFGDAGVAAGAGAGDFDAIIA